MKIRLATAAVIAAASFAASSLNAAPTGSQIPNVAAASDPKEMRPDVEGEFKVAPPGMFSTAELPAPVLEEVAVVEEVPVDDADTTRCGLTVLTTSENAVGDPCATTADVVASLNLTPEQIAYIDANSGIEQDQALAH